MSVCICGGHTLGNDNSFVCVQLEFAQVGPALEGFTARVVL